MPARSRRVLQRQRVDRGRQHAHVVGGRPVGAELGELGAAQQIAAAADDGDLDAEPVHARDLCSDRRDHLRRHASVVVAEALTADLQQDALDVARRFRDGRIGVGHGRVGGWTAGRGVGGRAAVDARADGRAIMHADGVGATLRRADARRRSSPAVCGASNRDAASTPWNPTLRSSTTSSRRPTRR
jgi:hypothetical protein